MGRNGKVNLETARVYRSRGWSYDRIAKHQGVTTSAVYYALNKHRREEKRRDAESHSRSVYLADEVWAVIEAHATKYGISASGVMASILAGELPSVLALREALSGPFMSAEQLWALPRVEYE